MSEPTLTAQLVWLALSYDEADCTTQIDRGTDDVSTDDLTITNIFTNQDWEKSRRLARGATTLQTTTRDYFANGKLRTLDIPQGYVSNLGGGQTVNPFTGGTISRGSSFWHWPFSSL